jgi:hypothetical protein
MAIIKTDSSIAEIYGRFGGVYFKRGKDGTHIQSFPRAIRKISMREPICYKTNPGASRGLGIFDFSLVALLWSDVVVAASVIAVQAAWLGFALLAEYCYNRKLTGYNWFQHYNVRRLNLNRPPYIDPPKSPIELPPFCAASQLFGKHTINIYETGVIHNGKPLYRGTAVNWEGSIFNLYYEPPYWKASFALDIEGPWWYWTGQLEEVVGYFEPANPTDYPLLVNF